MQPDKATIKQFQKAVLNYYSQHGRHDLPWRLPEPDGSFDPYKIMVSELMLQQTQVSRVVPKYHEFIAQFPDVASLAAAPLGQVITAWSGLGYNRRAKYLHATAQQVAAAGHFPNTITKLVKLPGVGKNTAAAIAVYAFNEPAVFVETNIRTVFIHHFFHGQTDVSDVSILKLVGATLDKQHPREWFWALMDYGSHLKRTIGNLNKLSNTYTRQSTFHGSRRQLRGQILRALSVRPRTLEDFHVADERLSAMLEALHKEGMIQKTGARYHL